MYQTEKMWHVPTQKTVILEGRVFKIVCSRERETLEVNLYFDRLLFDKT